MKLNLYYSYMAIWALFLPSELMILGSRRTLLLHVGLTLISLRTLSNTAKYYPIELHTPLRSLGTYHGLTLYWPHPKLCSIDPLRLS